MAAPLFPIPLLFFFVRVYSAAGPRLSDRIHRLLMRAPVGLPSGFAQWACGAGLPSGLAAKPAPLACIVPCISGETLPPPNCVWPLSILCLFLF
jgi:hypothetical protein